MNEQSLKQELVRVENEVNALTVSSAAEVESAGAVRIGLVKLEKTITEYFEDMRKPAWDAYQAILDKKNTMLKPVQEKKKLLDDKISIYLTEQHRIQEEAQRKEDERRRKIEERKKERLIKKANELAADGYEDKAEAVMDKVDDVYVPPVIVQSEVPQTMRTDSGTISQKKDIEVRVIDPIKILKAIIKKELPIGIVEISETKLKKHIELFKLKSLDGVTIEEKIKVQTRGR